MPRELLHEYEKTVVIRIKHKVYDDGLTWAGQTIDTDLPERDRLLAVLVRAQHYVIHENGGDFTDVLDLSDLPEFDSDPPEEDDDE